MPDPTTPGAFAEVAVDSPFPHRQTFSYSVPEGMSLAPGDAVHVPFGRLTLQGIVVDILDTPIFSEPEKIRTIRAKVHASLVDTERLALARWVAAYYLAPIFEALALVLPPGFERQPVTIVRTTEGAQPANDITPRQRELLTLVGERGRDVEWLRERLEFPVDPVVAQLERRNLVAREYALSRPRVRAKTVTIARLRVPIDEAIRRTHEAFPPKPSRRADVLERLLGGRPLSVEEAARIAGSRANLERLVHTGAVRYDRDGHHVELAASMPEAQTEAQALRQTARASAALAIVQRLDALGDQALPDLRAHTNFDAKTIDCLRDAGIVELREEAVERDPLATLEVTPRPAAALLPAQGAAASAIKSAISAGRHETFLLHGVTGSGKTEVYLDALDQCVAVGRRAIVLVPEIALTPQTIRRFRERFERVAVLHSGLLQGEQFDQWHAIAAGRYDVVIGSRSAVFAPQPDLGLIVLDEEHEWTYKQQDTQPRYHAREAAIELGRLTGAAVVLGSATPDVVSHDLARRGIYTILELPERVRPVVGMDGTTRREASAGMPRVDVVDLRDELRAGNRGMFSTELSRAVREALGAGEQVILFLNRRGLASHVQCRDCGHVPACSGCRLPMSFHRQYDRLMCHQCNRRVRLPAVCATCGSPRIRLLGAGAEKVEAEAARMFPSARLLRWDRDVTRTRGAHERVLAAFTSREADILIGTQMLAKGLDMPAVTVVGVVNADTSMHLPDFRSAERTFQLLTQVAGRAGRGERPGRVIIQTYAPEHYAVDAAARYDYEGFAVAELKFRRSAGFPPSARLVRLIVSNTNERTARESALQLQRALTLRRAESGGDTEIVGPAPAYVSRLRGRWRWQLLLRGRDPAALIRGFVLPRDVIVDVDPASLL